MKTTLVAFATMAALCSHAMADAGLEFRVIERTGQTIVSASDNVLDFAVQVRVTGSGSLLYGGGNIAVQFPGEAQTRGSLWRGAISNSDGTYFGGLATNMSGTFPGTASAYRYLIGINSSFNGGINADVGASHQDPTIQDIVGISPFPAGNWITQTPGLFTTDPDSGDLVPPPNNLVPADVANGYFGGGGSWVDLYRFRYLVTDLSPRTITSTVAPDGQKLFDHIENVNGLWRAALGDFLPTGSVTADAWTGQVVPGPGGLSAAIVLAGSGWAHRRRRRMGAA